MLGADSNWSVLVANSNWSMLGADFNWSLMSTDSSWSMLHGCGLQLFNSSCGTQIGQCWVIPSSDFTLAVSGTVCVGVGGGEGAGCK